MVIFLLPLYSRYHEKILLILISYETKIPTDPEKNSRPILKKIPDPILKKIPDPILKKIPDSILKKIPDSILKKIPDSILKKIPDPNPRLAIILDTRTPLLTTLKHVHHRLIK